MGVMGCGACCAMTLPPTSATLTPASMKNLVGSSFSSSAPHPSRPSSSSRSSLRVDSSNSTSSFLAFSSNSSSSRLAFSSISSCSFSTDKTSTPSGSASASDLLVPSESPLTKKLGSKSKLLAGSSLWCNAAWSVASAWWLPRRAVVDAVTFEDGSAAVTIAGRTRPALARWKVCEGPFAVEEPENECVDETKSASSPKLRSSGHLLLFLLPVGNIFPSYLRSVLR
mmetsp:Transcript_3912/g.9284  ORF Transcript_3912/g.9284 Transcript_3912/m.9284 type:complete len:226 (+) Transcript_3912:2362-3039(+)